MKQIKLCIAVVAMLFGVTSLSAQRGYHNAPYTRYEADQGVHNGTKMSSPSEQAHIAYEASERTVVQLTNNQYAEWTTTAVSRGIVVRASGASQTNGYNRANVNAYIEIDGNRVATINFNNDWGWKNLQADGNQNYNNVRNSNPRMRYHEERYLHSTTIPAGAKIRIVSGGNNLYLDFIEIENVDDPKPCPAGYKTYSGNGSDLQSWLDNPANNGNVYIPAGTYNIPQNVNIGSRTVQGAGMWHTRLHFTGWGVNNLGISAYATASLKDISLTSGRNARTDSHKGLNGGWKNGSVIENVWVEHFECGAWFQDGTQGLTIRHCRFRSNYADGINFCTNSNNNTVEYCSFRNNGDDDMAIWPANGQCSNNTFRYSTAEHCWFATSCAIYGGRDNVFENLRIVDAYEVGMRVGAGEFFTNNGPGFESGNVIKNVDIIRCGTDYGAYSAPLAAIDMYERNGKQVNIKLECIDIIDAPANRAIERAGIGEPRVVACGLSQNGALEGVNQWWNTNTNCNCATTTIIGVSIGNCPTSLQQGGATRTLTATVTGTPNPVPQTVNWTTSNASRATVSGGVVTTGSETGSVTITATSTIDGTKKGECTFNVTAIPVEGVTITTSKASLGIGETSTFAATVQPNTVNQAVTWSFQNTGAGRVTVNATTGAVTGVTAGPVRIIATSVQDGTKSNYVDINVVTVPVIGITLANQTIAIGGNATLTPNVLPANATNKNVTWSITSQNGTNISITQAGVVSGGATAGTAVIRATAQDGSGVYGEATITVTACTPVAGNDLEIIDVTWEPANPQPGQQVTFTATIKNNGQAITTNSNVFGVVFQIANTESGASNIAWDTGRPAGHYLWNDELKNNVRTIESCATIQLSNNGGQGAATWPAGAVGDWYVCAWADDGNDINGNLPEVNEGNNRLTKKITVSNNPCATPLTQPDPAAANIAYNATHVFNLGAATGGSGAITYQWQTNASGSWVNIPSATGQNYTTPALTTSTSYRRIATNATCSFTITSSAALITVAAANVPVTGITIAAVGSTTVTEGETVSFTADVQPANATNKTVTYEVVGGTGSGTFAGNVLTTTAAGTIQVKARATDGSGVESTNTVTITVEEAPEPPCAPGAWDLIVENLSWSPTNPQRGDEVIFTATIKNIGGNATPDGQKHGIAFDIVSGIWGEPSEYWLDATWNGDHYSSLESCGGTQVLSATGGNGASGRAWIPAENGIYHVRAFVNNDNSLAGEANTANNQTFAFVTVANPGVNVVDVDANDKSIIAYGNTVEIRGVEKGETVTVYNTVGVKIYSARAETNPEFITTLQPGVYIVQIEGTSVVKKVLIVQ